MMERYAIGSLISPSTYFGSLRQSQRLVRERTRMLNEVSLSAYFCIFVFCLFHGTGKMQNAEIITAMVIIFICKRAITINRTNIENKMANNRKKRSSQLAAHNKLRCTQIR